MASAKPLPPDVPDDFLRDEVLVPAALEPLTFMIRVRSVVVDLFNEHMQCMIGCIHPAQAAGK
jgi:hypothetical protein